MELLNILDLTKQFTLNIDELESSLELLDEGGKVKEGDRIILLLNPYSFNIESKLDISDQEIIELFIQAQEAGTSAIDLMDSIKPILIDKYFHYYSDENYFNKGITNIKYVNNKDDLSDTSNIVQLDINIDSLFQAPVNLDEKNITPTTMVYNKLIESVTKELITISNTYTNIIISNLFKLSSIQVILNTTDSEGEELIREDYYLTFIVSNLNLDEEDNIDATIYQNLIKQSLQTNLIPLQSLNETIISIGYMFELVLPILKETSSEWLGYLLGQIESELVSTEELYQTELTESLSQLILAQLSTINSDVFRQIYTIGLDINGEMVTLKYSSLQQGIQDIMSDENDVNSVVDFYDSLSEV